MKICVVIPVLNEARSVGKIVKLLKEKNLDVLVIDDGSTDESGDIARQNGANVITHDHKSGKGTSLREGFDYALTNGYEGIVTLDGDGQHEVHDIDAFICLAKEKNPTLIIGNRMNNVKDMPFVRLATNRFMSWLISLAAKTKIADTQCGYRYIKAQDLKKMDLCCRDFEIETEMILKCAKKGMSILSIPIKTIYGQEESKINPAKDTIRFFSYFLKEIFSSSE